MDVQLQLKGGCPGLLSRGSARSIAFQGGHLCLEAALGGFAVQLGSLRLQHRTG